jgi:hypothetical protein
MAGSHNDINVVQHSPVFGRLAAGNSPEVSDHINGHEYTKAYYVADGIYPQWSTFVKTISNPHGEKRVWLAKKHESDRKDVERAFSALQSRWAIVHTLLGHGARRLCGVMITCVIMHNMIIKDV